MKSTLTHMTAVWVVALSALAFAACTTPNAPTANMGKIQINLTNNINSRTLEPAINMNAASFTVTGTGPSNATFTATSSGAPVTKEGLAVGNWTIVVNAANASSDLIGTGTSVAQVNPGQTTNVAVTVTPISGSGTLSLGTSWPASQVHAPSISASLTPALGAPQALDFVISGASASYSNPSVPNGYYTLAFTLLDNGVAVAGAADVVRIVSGQTTSGTITFSNVNTIGGSAEVTITTNLQNPLVVTISGAQAAQSAGSTQTLTANVSNYTDSVVYQWYVNGVAQTTGSSFTFGSGVDVGYHRIDVTAYNADRTRAGAATQDVQVTASSGSGTGAGPLAVNLGTAGNYVILAQTGVTTTGTTAIVGDMGVSPIAAAAITGFGLALDGSNQFSTSSLVTGHVFAADYGTPTPATLSSAVSDMQAAYLDAAGRTVPDHLNVGGGTLAGDTLSPGLYNWGSAVSITSGITISGGPNDVWIFQVGGALTVADGVIVTLAGGALPQNIFWQVVGAASLGTTAQMKGVLLCQTAIALNTGASINGRLLAQTAVTLISSAVTQP